MNPPQLTKLARTIDLDSEEHFNLRIKFGIGCVERVEHLLTDESVLAYLSTGKAFLLNKCTHEELREAALLASKAARSHPGSGSLDGAGNAAVSASHGVAAALAGRALDAAGYAAYASVYSYSSHAATDLSAYKTEHDWQTDKLTSLVRDMETTE